ncbi:hypothetical protein J3459_010285 [Metarhizium acridum]|nr:hypothetical protein J3459_010285 [Metarhizium acridum]
MAQHGEAATKDGFSPSASLVPSSSMIAVTARTAAKELFENGMFSLDDPEKGSCVEAYERKGYPYSTEFGLDFCSDQVVMNSLVRSIVMLYFQGKKCRLGHWLRWKADLATECFIKGGLKAGRRAVVVHLMPRGSELRYWPGSHLHNLPTTEGKRSTYEVEESDLKDAGLIPQNIQFVSGAMVIRDARLSVRIVKEYAITFIFAEEDLAASWPKMLLPNLDVLKQKVANMESQDIAVNFSFGVRDAVKRE